MDKTKHYEKSWHTNDVVIREQHQRIKERDEPEKYPKKKREEKYPSKNRMIKRYRSKHVKQQPSKGFTKMKEKGFV